MYGENTKTMAIPIYRVHPVIVLYYKVADAQLSTATTLFELNTVHWLFYIVEAMCNDAQLSKSHDYNNRHVANAVVSTVTGYFTSRLLFLPFLHSWCLMGN